MSILRALTIVKIHLKNKKFMIFLSVKNINHFKNDQTPLQSISFQKYSINLPKIAN